jgi:phosphoadenosine phosphosulfate reductase
MINSPELSVIPRTKIDVLPSLALEELDLKKANETLRPLSASERIKWAVDTFPIGLYALTSAGIDSALTLDHIAKAADDNQPIPVIHINTGFLPRGTLPYLESLQKRYGFQLHQFGPTDKQIEHISDRELWNIDEAQYRRITKLNPLKRAIGELSVTALISGIRRDQTSNRADLGYIGRGNDGEIRVHPFINWSNAAVNRYIVAHELPHHPLYKRGFDTIDDWTLMGLGEEKKECGIHLETIDIVERAS